MVATDVWLPTVPVSKPFVQPSAAAVAEGTAVALSCAVREGTEPLSFSWQHREPRGGPSVSPPLGTVGARAELNLAPANRSHLGWYVCTVGNQVNSQASEPIYLDIVCECPVGDKRGGRCHQGHDGAAMGHPWPA